MSGFGVITYRENVASVSVELKTIAGGLYVKMRTNPMFVSNAKVLRGKALTKGLSDIAIYLNGQLANNSFGIAKGDGFITFEYNGSPEFLKNQFLVEVNLF
jgi:hypothetical protein